MRLNQLRDLLAAVEAGSLRAAARVVGVSQPAMTKSLRQLEHEIGAQLFRRTARGVELTPAGHAFTARARVIQTEIRKAGEDITALQGGIEGTVAIGVAPATSVALMPDAMRRFRERWPGARVRILEGVRNHLIPLVRDGTLDFAVAQVQSGAIGPGVRFRPLLRLRLAIACRRGHPLASARSLVDLADVSWLVFYPPGTGGALERTFAAANLPAPKALVYCESYATALSLLARGDLMGLVVRRLLIDEPFANSYLQPVSVKEEIVPPTIGIFSRTDTPLAPAAATMHRAVTAVARNLAAA